MVENRTFIGLRSATVIAIAAVLSLFFLLAPSGAEALQDRGITSMNTGTVSRMPYAMDIDGDYAVVGAQWHEAYKGAAYVLRRDGEEWIIHQRLSPSGSGPNDHFGGSVSISGDFIVVGSSWNDLLRGSVYVFRLVDGTWVEWQQLSARDAVPDLQFGAAVEIEGGVITVASAPGGSLPAGSGAIYRFERDGEKWSEQEKLSAAPAGDRLSPVKSYSSDQETTADVNEVIEVVEFEVGAFPAIQAAAVLDSITWVNATDGIYEDRVEITWEDIGRDDIVYKVLRNDTLLSVLSSDDTYYSDETGILGTTYSYCVVIKDMTGPESDPVCDDGSRIIFPPSAVTASDGNYTDRVSITWVDLSTINSGYHIYRNDSLIYTAGPNVTSYNDTDAVPDSVHSYDVAAFVTGGYESERINDGGWRGLILPPLGVTASEGEYPDFVMITWQDQAPDETGYRIYRDDILIDSTGVDSESYNDSTVVFGEAYTYCVATKGGGGIESIHVCDVGLSGLTAPGNVSASDSTFDDKVLITWDDLSNVEDGYEILRTELGPVENIISYSKDKNVKPIIDIGFDLVGQSLGDTVSVAVTDADADYYEDFSAVSGVSYEYFVRAVSDEGGYSLPESDIGYRSFVLAPYDVLATDGGYEDRTEITWQSTSTTAVLFMIYRDGIFIKSVNASSLSYGDYGGVAGQDYDYSVVAVTAMDSMSTESGDTGRRELRSPAPVSATDDEYEDRVLVSWSDNSNVEDGYLVFRRAVADSDSVLIAAMEPNRTSFADYYGISAVAYVYSVAAYDTTNGGEEGRSASISDEGRRLLVAPTGIYATDDRYEDRVEISWNDNSRAEDGYYIYRDTTLIHTASYNTTTYNDYGATLGQRHQYRVAAFDAIGPSDVSSDSGSVDMLPPATVNASDFYDNRIELTWIDQSDIEDGYMIFRDGEIRDTVTASEGCSYTDQSIILAMATLDTADPIHQIHVQGNYAYVRRSVYGAECGLYVIDISDVSAPTIIGSCHVPSDLYYDCGGMCFSGDYAYVANADGLRVIDISDPYNPTTIGGPTGWLGALGAVAAGENYAYALDPSRMSGYDVVVYNISNPAAPFYIYGFDVDGSPNSIECRGDYTILITGDSPALQTYIFFPPSTLLPEHSYGGSSSANDLFISGSYGYLVGSTGLHVLNLDNPGSISLLGANSAASGYRVAVSGGRAYVRGNNSLKFVDVSDPYNPAYSGSFNLIGPESDVAAKGDTVYVTVGDYGLHVISDYELVNTGQLYNYCVQGYSGDYLSESQCDDGIIAAGDPVPGVSGTVSATDGTEDSRVRVTWDDVYTGESGFLIYRDGALYDENVWPEIEFYNDTGAQRGRTYYYCVRVVMSPGDTTDVGCDFGWRPSNGAISGRVTTRAGAGVEGVSVFIDPTLTYSLLFDGSAGAVSVLEESTFDFTVSDDFTVEAWVKYVGDGGGDASIISKSSGSGSYPFELRTGGSGYPGCLVFAMSDGSETAYVESGSTDLNDNEWRHIACVYESGINELSLYVDGAYNGSASASGLGVITNDDQLYFGTGRSGSFNGQMDEVRIWNIARSDVQIRNSMYMPLKGDETGLIGYWTFDEGGGPAATDFAGDAQYGILENGSYWTDEVAPLESGARTDIEGNYVLDDLAFEEGDTLYVRPSQGVRQFQPAFKSIVLSEQSPVANNIGFVDITSYTISGEILLAGTACPVPDASIMVDGLAAGVSDKYGLFGVSVDNGEHTLSVELGDNTFDPAEVSMVVEADTSVDFSGTTIRTLYGSAGGGCGRYVGDISIIIESENGCLQDTVVVDSTSASYSVQLPPQTYIVSATVDDTTIPSGLNAPDVIDFFSDLGEREVDLTLAADTLDFVYRADLLVAIKGFEPYISCSQLTLEGEPLPESLPVLHQLDLVTLTIEVDETYGLGQTCPLDTGTVIIYDEIFDREDSTIVVPVSNGIAEYVTVATTPSLIAGRLVAGENRSYQKAIRATAVVEGKDPVSVTEWVLVTGHLAPEGTEFVTFTSDPMPLYILRDPPGDKSYAFLEEGFTKRSTIEWDQDMWSRTLGVNYSLGWGLNETFFYGLGAGKIQKFKIQTTRKSEFELGLINYEEGKTEQIVSTTERYSTSSSNLFVGEPGDVFVGGGFNFLFAEVDVIDVEGCEVVRSVDIGFQPDGITTEFAFSEYHIENILIPELEGKVDYYNDIAEEDSARIFQEQAENWQDWLDFNRDSKYTAESYENRSFSAGAEFQYTTQVDTVETFTKTTKLKLGNEASIGSSIELFGVEMEFSVKYKYTDEKLFYFDQWTETESHSVGYVLSDDDIGDNFTVDLKMDGKYRSPIFDVLGGVSSCPWEAWRDSSGVARMTPRDGAAMSIDPVTLYGVPADEMAVFNLELNNESDTDESRWYALQVYPGSNPDGAIVRADGAYINSSGISYFLEPGVAHQVTLTVQRGPVRYSYDSLKVMLYPPCEFANWQMHGEMQRAAIKTFNVHFDPPCSGITMSLPEDGWTFDVAKQLANDSIYIYLDEYQTEIGEGDEGLEVDYVGFRYRRLGQSEEGPDEWSDPIQADSLGSTYTRIAWIPPESLDDGVYEIQGLTHCSYGTGYSEIATGTIDRHAPVVFGTPEPADGILSFGEDIRVTFNEAIHCEAIDPGDVTLTYLDGPDQGSSIACDVVCGGDAIVIDPSVDAVELEGRRIEARASGITDLIGNPMAEDAVWEFEYRKSLFAWIDAGITCEAPYLSPRTITSQIVNGTTNPVDFMIVDSPSWITSVVPSSGSILPGGTRSVDLAIQGDLAIGTYYGEVRATATDTAGAVSTAVLGINLAVSCQAPDWIVDPSGFEHSMTLVAKLDIGSVYSTDTLDMVAAFAGSELRGMAVIDSVDVYDDDTGNPYSFLAFLPVYSNHLSGEVIRFQVWDASACKLYNATEQSYEFLADGVFGSPEDPVDLTAIDVYGDSVLTIPVAGGWNWISTNILSADMSADAVLADLTPSAGDIIKSQTEFSQYADPVDGWVPGLTLDNVSAYMVNLASPGTILHTGAQVLPTGPVPVSQGWNWIGYLPDGPIGINSALADLASQDLLRDNDLVKGQDAFVQFDSVSGYWFGSLIDMEPGRGYKLYLAGAVSGSFAYPEYVGSYLPATLAVGKDEVEKSAQNMPSWTVDPHDYQYNMTLTVVLCIDGVESIDCNDMIGAFVDGECRGMARSIYIDGTRRYTAFLMIHSNEIIGESLEFRAFDASSGLEYDAGETLDFVADASIGTVQEPFLLNAISEEDETPEIPKAFALYQNVPNPFNPATVIRFDLPRPAHVTLRIYSVKGELISTLADGHMTEGRKELSWLGRDDGGRSVASGVYFYRLIAGGFVQTRKMVLLR